jgi:hypothetical protein
MSFKRKIPWTKQPQYSAGLNQSNPFTKGLVYLTGAPIGGDSLGKAGSLALTGATYSPGIGGVGLSVNGGSDKATVVGVNLPTTGDFTLECLVSMTAAPSLAQVFGFGLALPDTAADGSLRYILTYPGTPGNIYFWGGSADKDSGVAWRTDGSLQHVFITYTGGTLYFYRDGRQIASGAPGASLIAAQTNITVGSKHVSGASSPTFKLYKGAIYNRALSAIEVASLSQNPWQVFQPLQRNIWAPSVVTTTTLYLRNTQTNGIGSTYYDMLSTAGASSDTAVVNATVAGTEIQWTKTAGGAIAQWISGRAPAGGFTLTQADISVWVHQDGLPTNIGGRYRVFKRAADTTETELGGGPFDNGVEFGTTATETTWTGNVTDTAFAEDDRILIKLYITNIGVMAVGTGTLTFNAADAATGDSFITITPAVTFKAAFHPSWARGSNAMIQNNAKVAA